MKKNKHAVAAGKLSGAGRSKEWRTARARKAGFARAAKAAAERAELEALRKLAASLRGG